MFDNRWTEGVPENPANWKNFPPQSDALRQEAWKHNKDLYRGRHKDIFKSYLCGYDSNSPERHKVSDVLRTENEHSSDNYLVANILGLISKTCASLLFGEQIKVSPTNADEDAQHTVNIISNNNNLQSLNLQQARTSSAQGYTFYRVRYGKLAHWQDEDVLIEAIPGKIVNPHVSPDNIKEICGYTISFEFEKNKQQYLKREIHLPGKIENKVNIMDGTSIGEEVPLSMFDEFKHLIPVFEHDYPGFFIEMVSNLSNVDEFWGVSDYEDIEGQQGALNNRISDIESILNRHANPILVLPTGIMEYDGDTERFVYTKWDRDAMELDDAEVAKYLPRYVTWDAQLNAAFEEFDKILDMLMLTSQISPVLFGGMKQFGSAESGRALKLRMVQTLAKINEKRLEFDAALKNVFYAAQWLRKYYDKTSSEPVSVSIEWNDGLPDDDLEIAQIYSTLKLNDLISKREAVKRIQKIDGKELESELLEIQKGEFIARDE